MGAPFISRLVIALVFLVGGAIACSVRGAITVTITNEGTLPITNLSLLFSGGSQRLERLVPGQIHSFVVRAKGESDLVVNFVDGNSNAKQEKLDVYFGPHFRGWIAIKIDSQGTVQWTAAIH